MLYVVLAMIAALYTSSASAEFVCYRNSASLPGECWLERFVGTSDADLTAAGWVPSIDTRGVDYNYAPLSSDTAGNLLRPSTGEDPAQGGILELYSNKPASTITKVFPLPGEGALRLVFSYGGTLSQTLSQGGAATLNLNGSTRTLTNIWYPADSWWTFFDYVPGGDVTLGFTSLSRCTDCYGPVWLIDGIGYRPYDQTLITEVVPLPPAMLLLMSGLGALGVIGARRRTSGDTL